MLKDSQNICDELKSTVVCHEYFNCDCCLNDSSHLIPCSLSCYAVKWTVPQVSDNGTGKALCSFKQWCQLPSSSTWDHTHGRWKGCHCYGPNYSIRRREWFHSIHLVLLPEQFSSTMNALYTLISYIHVVLTLTFTSNNFIGISMSGIIQALNTRQTTVAISLSHMFWLSFRIF